MNGGGALEKKVNFELEMALTKALRVPGTKHDVLLSFLAASDVLVRDIATSVEELTVAQGIRNNRANSLRHLLGVAAKYC